MTRYAEVMMEVMISRALDSGISLMRKRLGLPGVVDDGDSVYFGKERLISRYTGGKVMALPGGAGGEVDQCLVIGIAFDIMAFMEFFHKAWSLNARVH